MKYKRKNVSSRRRFGTRRRSYVNKLANGILRKKMKKIYRTKKKYYKKKAKRFSKNTTCSKIDTTYIYTPAPLVSAG